MFKKIEVWLNLQRFEEEWDRYRAFMLIISTFIAFLASGIAFVIEALTRDTEEFYEMGGLALVSLILLALIWRGYVREVGWVFPFAIFLVLAIHVNHSEGMFDNAMFAFPAVILMGGLLNRRRGILVFTFLALVAVSIVGINQINRPEPFLFSQYATISRLGSILALLAVSGGMAFLAINSLLLGLQKLQESESALTHANRELRHIQVSMEATIEERTRNIEAARREAEMGRRAIEAQAWIATGLSQLNDAMRGEQSISALADNILKHLCRYLDAQVAALFILEHGRLKRVGGFAFAQDASLPDEFEVGEGLVGQAALNKEIIVLEDIPEGSLRITSGLGNAFPKYLVLLPLLYADELIGVIELGTLNLLTLEKRNYITLAEASIAVSIRTTIAHIRLNELLLETQQQAEELQSQAEEMQAQEEELRAANEELYAQAERLRASQSSSEAM